MKLEESFYDYYSRELTYLRQQGSQFAQKHPKVAQRLDFTSQVSSDPHVERLLESFAFMAARLQQDIDQQYPRLTNALLGILYPQFINPLPSLSIAEFNFSPQKGKLSSTHTIQRETKLFVTNPEGETCRFQTCYDVSLRPIEVKAAEVIFSATQPDCLPYLTSNRALKLTLKSFNQGFKSIGLTDLRFFLEGSRLFKNSLYEGLFAQENTVVIQNTSSNPFLIALPAGSLKQVGFKPHESVVPYPKHAHPGYRFLFEYFHFPEKFYFFDIDPIVLPDETSELTIFISLADSFTYKANAITAGNFRLHCSPIINLFNKTSEPIRLDYQRHEYRLIGDLKHEKTTEIHSISQVQTTLEGTSLIRNFKPYFSYDHLKQHDQACFWNARRVPALNNHLGGTDIFLSFVDQNMDPAIPTTQNVFAQLLCTNRALAPEFSAGTLLQPEQENPAAQIICLYRPTLPYYPSTEASSQWRFISQLSLNYLALSNDAVSLQALKEIIQLYAGEQDSSVLPELETIHSLKTKSVMRRFGLDAWRGFVSGTHIQLIIDLEKDVQKNTFLFASVLNHFFALFASVNSFTQLELYQHNNKGSWKTWPPMSGSKPLL